MSAPARKRSRHSSQRREAKKPPAELPQDIEFEADGVEGTRDGDLKLTGKVEIRQGERRIHTRDATYNPQDESFDVDEGVEYSDGQVNGARPSAHTSIVQAARSSNTPSSSSADRNARGSADRIRATTEGTLSLDRVRYTTCPLGNEDWMLTASDIDINQSAGIGIGRGVRLDFKGVPLLYTPFISFPVGNERKSGFLFLTIGILSRSGYSLSVPWYWNIAPNYDATLTPTYFSKRGLKLDTEFRYPDRGRRQASSTCSTCPTIASSAASAACSISSINPISRAPATEHRCGECERRRMVRGFRHGPEGTSVTYLNRSANLTYLDDHWFAHPARPELPDHRLRLPENRMPIPPAQRPYTMLPQVAVRANFPDQPYRAQLRRMDFELVKLRSQRHRLCRTGWRADFAPEIRMPLRERGRLYRAVGEHGATRVTAARRTAPSLDNDDDTFTRSAPILSVDGGMVFERLFGSRKQRLSTIEPRFMYLYVPYRNQDDLPVFDTEARRFEPACSCSATNRYAGADRLGDANRAGDRRHLALARRQHRRAIHRRHRRPGLLLRSASRDVAGRSTERYGDLRHHRRARMCARTAIGISTAAFDGTRARRARGAAS